MVPQEPVIDSQTGKAGLPPGSLIYVGEKKRDQVQIQYVDYDAEQVNEQAPDTLDACLPLEPAPTVRWLTIAGLHDTMVIKNIGQQFNIHPLLLEDILNTNQRPKLEDAENCLLVVVKVLRFNETSDTIQSEQVSLVLAGNAVISFQEDVSSLFDSLRHRIRNNKGKIRKCAADYLFYTLLDAVVDSYLVELEKIGDHLESLEEELITEPSEKTLFRIHGLKREMVSLRRSLWPLREITANLERGDSELIRAKTHPYFRDVVDHVLLAIDTVEGHRDMISSMLDLYLSSISHRMNKVMQVLTLTATIFIPLTFVAGIYGMNFEHMPELKWRYGYLIIWSLMIIVGGGMAWYFKRKKWL